MTCMTKTMLFLLRSFSESSGAYAVYLRLMILILVCLSSCSPKEPNSVEILVAQKASDFTLMSFEVEPPKDRRTSFDPNGCASAYAST